MSEKDLKKKRKKEKKRIEKRKKKDHKRKKRESELKDCEKNRLPDPSPPEEEFLMEPFEIPASAGEEESQHESDPEGCDS